MKRTIRFKRSTQPKRKISKMGIVLMVFVGLLAFCAGFLFVRPLFLLLGFVS